MSGRSCSAAWAVLFACGAAPPEEALQRAVAEPLPPPLSVATAGQRTATPKSEARSHEARLRKMEQVDGSEVQQGLGSVQKRTLRSLTPHKRESVLHRPSSSAAAN